MLSSWASPRRGRTKELNGCGVRTASPHRWGGLQVRPWRCVHEPLLTLSGLLRDGTAMEPVSHRQAKARLSRFLTLFYPFPAPHRVFTYSSYLFSDQCNAVQCYILKHVMMASGAQSMALETCEPCCNVTSFCQSTSFCKKQAFARCSVLSNFIFANQREKESQKTYLHFLQRYLHAFDLSTCANIFHSSSPLRLSFLTFLLSTIS